MESFVFKLGLKHPNNLNNYITKMQIYLLIPRILIICTILIPVSWGCKNKSIPTPEVVIKTHGIIPLPKQLDFTGENITFNQDFTFITSTIYPIASSSAEKLFKNILAAYKISQTLPTSGSSFQLINDKTIKDDAYKLSVNKSGIQISAGNEAGAFWAVQTLKQYLWNSTTGKIQNAFILSGITIADEPRYSYRGFHLDVARHFFTKDYILKIIDWLSYYKFNKFHLHLTDDQGWRIESQKFPLLNSVGSWRTYDHYDSICIARSTSNPDFRIDPRFIQVKNGVTMYGGFYTRQDIAEIVNYATAHFIEVIPEVDMPGHMSAAIKAYPQLSCTGSTGWSTEFSYPICPCTVEINDFALQIWDEISAQFPSDYMHLGADEVDKTTWKASSDCTAFMKANNLISTNDIQSFFVGNLQKHLESKGKTAIAWDYVTDGKINSNLKIMYWRDWMPNAPKIAAANGNQVIFTRWDLFYFSSPYSEENLKKLLEFDVSQLYTSDVTGKIIGFQGCVWSEEIPSEAQFEAQVFPRLQALSEVNWSANRDFYSFTVRMAPHRSFLKANNVNLKN